VSEANLKSNQPIRGIWQWLRNQIVREVPEGTALCEFDCRKGQCTMDRRLNKAAGELTPSPQKTSPPHGDFSQSRKSTVLAI
jgi:hypothetical protein